MPFNFNPFTGKLDLTNIGTITGTGVSGQVAYWNGTSSLTGNANFVFNGSNLGIASSGTLVGALTVGQVAAPKSVVLPGFDGTNALLTIGSFDNTPSILGLVVIDHPDDYTGVANLTLVGDVSYQAPAFKIVDSFYSNLITFNADAQWIMEGSSGLFEYSGTYGLIFNNIATDSITGIRLFGGTSAGYLEIKNSTASTPTSGDRNFARVTGTFSPTSGTATYKTFVIAPTINQTGGANGITRGLYINPTLTAAADFRALDITGGSITLPTTITAGGTTGNQTINKITGTVNIAAAGTTVTVTNSYVTTSSIIFAVIRTNDTTATIKNVVPGAGSFVINLGAAATAEVSIGFFVINK